MTCLKLSKIAEIRPGYLSRGQILSTENGAYAILQIKDFNESRNQVDFTRITRFDPASRCEHQVLSKGDVLFLGKGHKNFAFPVGDLPSSTVAAGYFFVLKPDTEKFLPEFLAWYLNQPVIKKYLHKYSGRSVHIPVVSRAVLENIEVPVLPLAFQRNIVELDRLLSEEEELCRQLHEKRSLLLEAACLKGATPKASV
jgi:hypothetical protein